MGYDNQQLTSDHVVQTLQNVRSICSAFPSVEEHIDGFGHTSLRVKDKPFIIKTPYIGQHGWVTQQIEPPTDWDEIEDLIREAYLRTAPKKLAARVQDPVGDR
ncbi:MmcQ/YjbR family DNA-binding protein [Paenibacillus terrigena]|uniref:MmcQ/YjbR family DNA-binding protein n=1 Tax=Paenibacillus terrigena TaxID=369333 RepID=UPI0028D79183|nr:MmcQ/YjbR family DNA-binding protein [Paenibacillus terrigena]